MQLSDGIDDLLLPDDMEIIGLWGSTPIALNEGRGLSGKVISRASEKVGGMPYTLRTIRIGGGFMGILPMAAVETLQAWGEVADKALTWQISDALSKTVRFRHVNGQPFDAQPLHGFAYQGRADWWAVSIYLQSTIVEA